MAITKSYTREVHDAGRVDAVQTLTSTGTALTNYGVTVLDTTSTGQTWTIGAPAQAGLRKTIVVSGDATGNGTINVASTSVTIDGSTATSLLVTAGDAVEMVGVSTSGWALIAGTTA